MLKLICFLKRTIVNCCVPFELCLLLTIYHHHETPICAFIKYVNSNFAHYTKIALEVNHFVAGALVRVVVTTQTLYSAL